MSQLKRISFLLMAILLPVLLAACSGENTATESETSQTQLSETFSVSEGGIELTFNYPQGWVTQEVEEMILLANSQESLDTISSASLDSLTVPEGGYGMIVVILPSDEMPPEINPTDLLTMMAEGAASEGVMMEAIEEIEIDEQMGAKADVTFLEATGEIYLLKSNEYSVMVYAAASDYADFEDTTQAVVNTIKAQ
ncbi:hypothetical protein G4Y79_04660 [Phototrophicus methaneseepsis]|uniref:PsbP C-terminal domain-containing protein n=1 Tax=Phototrophicus methaneseepsis TaxID=2710758 RepID=A0A7S8EBF4_9CHLR|nr:hypothetical protein [Phototrophicus methaneseepsis]QPC83678.1 hypothetical protein G4Y79_04660 [Phototrophicus methaneseepsis]